MDLEISPLDICNLARFPVSIFKNPLTITAKILLENSGNSLERAEDYLCKYYKNLSFGSVNELYEIEVPKLSSISSSTYFLPWYHKMPANSVEDRAFIFPIRRELVRKKVEKINNIIVSIDKFGYDPERFKDRKGGFITGYSLLDSKGNKRFYVVSGNHRVACLSAIGFEKIPIIFEKTRYFKERDKVLFGWDELPDTICESSVETWPSVKSGFLDKEEALKIFKVYMR